ncbi:hypothetical protein FD50_GL000809 [Liquorilactobacillus satsumensis DSM 16230 = JCM 12392]|uniref:Uncharacterized protein n=1 Tax=Liquorilactobacillus satsumensis DSM 16230 = JCM 12392 TaxID=1423801 RepID=A0A0R1UZA6_9LACO|nr:hypothetical protein FD50_GL000809 [Liquorilactobacillus satsumensis DSM 16230 = JCM 12392]
MTYVTRLSGIKEGLCQNLTFGTAPLLVWRVMFGSSATKLPIYLEKHPDST